MRIGIVGAGGIGGWLGVLLGRQGHELSVLARGETLAALKAGPWRLTRGEESLEAPVLASSDAGNLSEQDVVILALKSPALPVLAPSLAPMIGPQTIVVPAMNGVPWWFLLAGGGRLGPTPLHSVDPRGAVAAAIPLKAVLGCVVHASVSVAAPGHVLHKAGDRLILGEPGGGVSPRVDALASALREAGFTVQTSPAIQQDVWYKLWGNMTMNPISALTSATCDRILDDPLVEAFVLRVMAEAAEIGGQIGCGVTERGEDRNKVTRQLGAFRTSMLQDAEAGRPIELDAMLAGPREIAQSLGIATPNMDALLGLTRLFARSRGLYPT